MEHASELRGFLVVARKEGAQLGHLSAIYVDPVQKRIAALTFRKRWLGGGEYFVPIDAVQTLGRDVVLISSENEVTKIGDGKRPPGRSLKDLQGTWVTTANGKHLGTLVDLDFNTDWNISDLSLADDRELPIELDALQIGDEIIVPAEYADRVRSNSEAKPGFLRQLFGSESVDETKRTLKRALSREATTRPKGRTGKSRTDGKSAAKQDTPEAR